MEQWSTNCLGPLYSSSQRWSKLWFKTHSKFNTWTWWPFLILCNECYFCCTQSHCCRCVKELLQWRDTWYCRAFWIYGQIFDCLNVRNQIEGIKKWKSFLQPYTNLNAKHFKWLKNDFLHYLLNWKMSIIDRPGNFSQTEKDKMFLSWQTCEGQENPFNHWNS